LSAPVVVLAGGTGGAKLARGMLDVVPAHELVVVANTGDDIEIYGAYVSPDPDLVTFWLADRIDDRGWGLDGDTFNTMDGLRQIGVDIWFHLGDHDLAIGIERARALRDGARLTDAHDQIVKSLGVQARVLPMSDHPVRTRVLAQRRWWPFQEFMIKAGGAGPVQAVDFHGARAAPATEQVREAIATARAIVIGPSNPIASIGPILATAGIRDALRETRAPVVAVSPIVRGAVLKGPTAAFMQWAGQQPSSSGIANIYEGVIDGLIADERMSAAKPIAMLETDVLMDTPESRRKLAEQTLSFALGLLRRAHD
jgi:LPPG:FO 2-phospho-L-lactate transferase